MISKMNGVVLLGGLAVLASGCAMGPVPPSLPPGQFIVTVKGEPGPLKSFSDSIQGQIERKKLPGCEKRVPPLIVENQGATAGGASIDEQLVYQCAAVTQEQNISALEIFAAAYGNSIASLLEMKVTTSGACVPKTCYGGPLRYWRQAPPCAYLC